MTLVSEYLGVHVLCTCAVDAITEQWHQMQSWMLSFDESVLVRVVKYKQPSCLQRCDTW